MGALNKRVRSARLILKMERNPDMCERLGIIVLQSYDHEYQTKAEMTRKEGDTDG